MIPQPMKVLKMHQSIRIYISKFRRNSWNGNGEKSLYEVDRFDDLDDLLQKDGFRGVYKARTGEACDGCAVFWKDKLFTLLHEEHIEFQSFGLRNNVAQFCVLKRTIGFYGGFSLGLLCSTSIRFCSGLEVYLDKGLIKSCGGNSVACWWFVVVMVGIDCSASGMVFGLKLGVVVAIMVCFLMDVVDGFNYRWAWWLVELPMMNENQSETGLCTEASKTISPKRRSLVIGNIHVLFNPNRGDIKLGQVFNAPLPPYEETKSISQFADYIPLSACILCTQDGVTIFISLWDGGWGGWGLFGMSVRIFLEKAYKLSQEWGNIPIIIGGDLNSLPQSAIYQFLTASELEILLHDRRNISGQLECPPQKKDLRSQDENVARSLIYRWSDEELRLATGNEELTHLQHELKLYSAYLGVPGSRGLRDNRGEPLATSYHSKFMGTVDYIWHTKGLIPVRVLETLPINILRRSAGLPNEKWGSDHLALVCELAFANDGTIV
ncbi:hypothetical protein POTOM_041908 [Populus tomentosa]|uniref:Endonuclease/exonuclease/phosphatase domain-containing protein n=1 Tax=Populus tomentosa TaxID=118781 RepID=A0A8X7YSR7_POPTO|nr:hypothetical protein POTOM_041908 [Populus tomentosa]